MLISMPKGEIVGIEVVIDVNMCVCKDGEVVDELL